MKLIASLIIILASLSLAMNISGKYYSVEQHILDTTSSNSTSPYTGYNLLHDEAMSYCADCLSYVADAGYFDSGWICYDNSTAPPIPPAPQQRCNDDGTGADIYKRHNMLLAMIVSAIIIASLWYASSNNNKIYKPGT